MTYLTLEETDISFTFRGSLWHEFICNKTGQIHCFEMQETDGGPLIVNAYCHSVGWLAANGWI